jgi:hypothetical protein
LDRSSVKHPNSLTHRCSGSIVDANANANAAARYAHAYPPPDRHPLTHGVADCKRNSDANALDDSASDAHSNAHAHRDPYPDSPFSN